MYVDVFVSVFPEIKFVLSFIRRLPFSLRSSHFGSLSLVLISVLFGFCRSFLSGLCHLSTSPLLSLLFSLSQFLCLYFCENLSTIHSMFLNPFPTLLLFLIASKVDFHFVLLGFWVWVFLALLLMCHPFRIIMWPFELDLAFPHICFFFLHHRGCVF